MLLILEAGKQVLVVPPPFCLVAGEPSFIQLPLLNSLVPGFFF